MSVARRLTITAGALGALAVLGLWQGGGSVAAGPAATSAPLGRANPFKPLITEDLAQADATGGVGAPIAPPPPPGAPAFPAEPPAPPKPTAAAIAYVAIASDTEPGATEGPIAAVRVDGRTRFLRVGDTVGGATIIDIASHELTLRSPAGATRVVPRATK